MILQSRNYLIGFIDFPLIYEALCGVNGKCRDSGPTSCLCSRMWENQQDFEKKTQKQWQNKLGSRADHNRAFSFGSGRWKWVIHMEHAFWYGSLPAVFRVALWLGGFDKNESWGRRLSLYFRRPWFTVAFPGTGCKVNKALCIDSAWLLEHILNI